MDVKTLCLGLLSIREACGYDLKKEFESIFKHFYSAGYGSIYPALADLADHGLVSCREIPQAGKPDRKTYQITESGRQAFEHALNNTTPQHKVRSEFMAMLYFADLLEPERLRELLDEREIELRSVISDVDRIVQSWGNQASPGARFVAGFSTTIAKAAADYIDSNRDQLLAERSPVKPVSRDTTSPHPATAGVEDRT